MYYVYILKCSDNTFYKGLTTNLQSRIKNHKLGKGLYTKSRLPIKLIWTGIFPNKHKAAEFEQYLKTGSGNAFMRKRLTS